MGVSVMTLWLAAGVIMLLAEALGVSGVGLLFAGMGALSVGTLIYLDFLDLDATLLQYVAFLIATALWAAILWKPLRNLYSSRNKEGYKNMVGDTAYVGSGGLVKGQVGEATWSGTIMKAQIIPDALVESLEAGTPVIIVEVRGTTLLVQPKP